ncbi:tape measure protein [Acinetobacter lwoffii]|uniref:tape measure protein n=1 Tax=Acinetobacter lwoffii TaxID=28090 RepID=UPI00300A12C5
MVGKELTFKLVINADTKDFVSNVQQSEKTAKAFFDAIKIESDKLKTTSEETAKEVGKIVPDDLQKKADQAKGKLSEVAQAANALETQASQASGKIDGLGSELQDTANKANKAGFEIGSAIPGDAVQLAEMLGNKFFSAAKEIESLGDKSTISAGELRAMSSAGEQGLNELNLALKAAQAELVRLQSTDGTLQDIEIAKQRVLSIQDAINEASSAFNYYQGVAINAMKGVDGATQSAINQVQRFSAVDLTGVVGEAQTATRAIESMGDGASLSTKEIERIGSIGTNSINTLERELLTARNAFSALEKSSEAVTLNEIKAAGDKVKGLEQAVDLTKSAFSEFNVKATTAMQGVSTSTDKASGSAKQAGHAIYDALGIKPPSVINDAIADLTRKLENFKANSKLPAEEVERVTKITEQQIEKLKSELNGVEPAAQKANSGVSTLSKGMDGAKFAVTALVGALATIGVGLGLRELAQAADSYTNLSARINIATSDGGNFQQAMAGVHQVALMTNSSLDATAGLFTKVNDTGKQMGMTQQQSLDLVKTINMAIQTGGGSAAAADAAITQFTQALQSGVLRGDEFNSIMEQAPGISKALAQSLGVTTDELRKMAENGELSAEKVIKALQSQSAAIEADYAKFPTTIGNALQRITTQWQILIGTMDQANGASATVAQWLVTLADNMDVVETILEDIGEGFIWVGDQLKKIDSATIEAFKEALSTAYEAVKSLVTSLGSMFGTTAQVLDTALSAIFDFNSGIDGSTDKTNGFTKALQGASLTFALFNDGFKGIAIVVNLFAGAMYEATGAFMYWKSKFMIGDAKEAAFKEFQDLTARAKELYGQADELALNHEVQVKKVWEEIGKTQDEKNREAVAGNTATFAELSKQNQEFSQKSKDLAGERAAIDAQLNQARKDGNQSTIDAIIQKSNELEGREKEHAANKAALDKDMLASAQDYAEAAIKANGGVMDGVMQANLLTKGYIVTIDEAGKVSVQASQSAEQAAESAAKKEEALKLAKENVKKADEEYLAYQKQAAAERELLEQQIEQAKKSGDLNALASAQTSIDAINAKEAELAKNRDLRIAELNKANTGSGQVAETAYSRASAAAKLFGVDLDVSLNKVSKSFSSSGNELDGLKTKLGEAGYTGKQAGDVLYQAWEEWLSKAKSQAEIDAANAKMREFEAQGVFSTKQVELGIAAIKRATSELPDVLDETGRAFERLGIKTKEQLRLSAQMALADFETVRQSGQATQADLQKAYEKTIQLAYASGDAQSIAAANAKAASLGLSIQVSETGQVSVKANNAVEESLHRVRNATGNAGDGFDDLGRRGVRAGNDTTEAWEEARKATEAAMASQGKMKASKTGTTAKHGLSVEEIEQRLKDIGYEGDTKQKAKELFQDAEPVAGGYYKSASNEWVKRKYGTTAYDNQKALGNAMYVMEQIERLEQYVGKNGRSIGSSNLNDYAPSIPSVPSTKDYGKGGDSVNYNIQFGGQTLSLTGDASQKDVMTSLVNQLKGIAKST